MVYNNMKRSKELGNALEKRYKIEDARLKKFIVSKFLKFTMMDTKSVVIQVQELQVIIHNLLAEGIHLSNAFVKSIKYVNTYITIYVRLVVNDAF